MLIVGGSEAPLDRHSLRDGTRRSLADDAMTCNCTLVSKGRHRLGADLACQRLNACASRPSLGGERRGFRPRRASVILGWRFASGSCRDRPRARAFRQLETANASRSGRARVSTSSRAPSRSPIHAVPGSESARIGRPLCSKAPGCDLTPFVGGGGTRPRVHVTRTSTASERAAYQPWCRCAADEFPSHTWPRRRLPQESERLLGGLQVQPARAGNAVHTRSGRGPERASGG